MISKRTIPIIEKVNGFDVPIVVGTKVEYRIFGILLYKKILLLPIYYGFRDWFDFPTQI